LTIENGIIDCAETSVIVNPRCVMSKNGEVLL